GHEASEQHNDNGDADDFDARPDEGGGEAVSVETVRTDEPVEAQAAPAREPRRRSEPRSSEPKSDDNRRSRQPAAQPALVEAEAPARAAPQESAAAADENSVLARVRARQAATAEPKLERVVVTPDESGSAQAAEDAPKRGGWWQRRLGG
ncbi:MAG TPA: ribonuclease E/G, partial [Hyphomicrobium sp.]|nr:ribonuclease E/G [Hyphomicrobium sp.]